ncbi:MAG: 3-isopropylmalate dehydrogenase [Rhodospirillaceae bacterium]|nr:3-isopropylmalate dehydrogenase [Rhodospirillaceae bacterium]
MATTRTILILPGDGIGPEVCRQVRRAMDWLGRARGLSFTIQEGLIGGAALDHSGVPITEETMQQALAADAVLLGAVGGPKWDGVAFDLRPEAALLRLRSELGLFANLRPAKVFPALADTSPLKPDIVAGLDILIVRELTGGVYFGEPRGIFDLPDGGRRGVNTQTYTTEEIRRVAAVAFDIAATRSKRVCSVEKANVMESGRLWREEVTQLKAERYPGIELTHMYADNCAMQLVRDPKQFDVIVTDNLFGDILSDEAAMLTGSLGMLPSASLGKADRSGRRRALYEPVHGSAPDIAGRDIANPVAMLLSLAMMLRHSFGLMAEAELLETAIEKVLTGGMRTADIMAPGMARVSTGVMGDSILRALDKTQAAA